MCKVLRVVFLFYGFVKAKSFNMKYSYYRIENGTGQHKHKISTHSPHLQAM